ncbi:MAG: adenylate/guanylate cyclase domain-containing protein [Gammaproteobacteria bacterium]|nr:adenylate/guanylate cyclase domain-containing protein [Gammaproteobacteria bacterium]
MKNLIKSSIEIGRWFAGKLVITDIPDRIRQSIQIQQIESERIIGWTQLFIVSVFSVLYILSPKTFPESGFAPVPWFLGFYFVFTVIRLYLSYRSRITPAFLVLSIIVDMGLLFGLIWTFHIQYEQPASFYLKAPTLIYLFIFIALRSLRFEAIYVVIAGLAAAAGWMLLVAYSIHQAGMESITRDYVEYLTSNKILIGAEWDKVISILLVTGILAVGISRGQNLLKVSLKNAAAAQDLSRFVPDVIAEQIKEDSQQPDLSRTETGECSILFIDLESFTTISESMTPARLLETLNQYFAVAAEPIHAQGGVINQFQGDAILASFNIPRKNPHHARDAIRAGLEILVRLREERFHDCRLKARVGINTGNVTGGLVGITERVHYTVHGDDVNIAARLEQLNKQMGTRILVSEETRRHAAGDFDFIRVDEVNLRGRTSATTLYTIRDSETGEAVS